VGTVKAIQLLKNKWGNGYNDFHRTVS